MAPRTPRSAAEARIAGTRFGGDRHHDGVRRLRRRVEIGVAGQAQDLAVLRIDREDAAAIAEGLEVRDDAGGAPEALGGAHDRHALRSHQGREVHGLTQPAMAIASISTRALPISREHSKVVRAGGSTGKYWLKTSFMARTSPRSTM